MATRTSSAALALALLLAGAANARASTVIDVDPTTIAGWQLTGLFGPAGPGRGGDVILTLSRGAREALDFGFVATGAGRTRPAWGEVHYFAATGPRVTVAPTRVRADLGQDGRIAMRFTARGRPRTLPAPRGCRGRGPPIQRGTLSGSLTLAVGLPGLPELRLRSLRATKILAGDRVHCPTEPRRRTVDLQPDTLDLSGPQLDISRDAREATASVKTVRDPTAAHPIRVTNLLLAFLPRSALQVAPDLSSARFTGAGPLIGTVTFTARRTHRHFATGTLAGPLSAQFFGGAPFPVLGAQPTSGVLDTTLL